MKSAFATVHVPEDAPRLVAAPRSGVLHEIFETQADARPEAVAVVFGREEVTYAGLESRANRLARHLRRIGVARGSVVAMLLPRSVDAYVALLGILKAGAAYVPIDPEYPADRVACIIEDSGAGVLVTTANLAARNAAFGGAVLRVDADGDAIAAESPARLLRDPAAAGPRDLCYIIYTSGSTGRPKGVMVEHRNACHLVLTEGQLFAVRPEDRVYQGFSLSFDASVEEVWLAFHAGATLVAATPEMAHAGPDLSRLLTECGVTVLSCVPTLLSMLEEDVPTLHLLILGGEACPDRLVSRWARLGRRMVNTYGPTETTVIATYADLSPERPVAIGRPVPGYRVHLLDDELRPVPRGQVGEICIGGVGVARGYVGLANETRARFVPDPFALAGEVGARIYRTGDLGRFDAEGNLEFVGRADGQVKLRGFRVELTEIESVLLEAEGVLATACAVREDVPGVQQLVGYVVSRNGPIDEGRLRSHLRDRLPAYMVPALIETVGDLPRLPSGKLDRASLPAPQARTATPQAPTARPRTATERRIAEVWEALFRPLPVSLDSDFFLDLGGHSLLVAQMVSELRKDPQFARVSVTDVYEHPTIASLASALDAAALRPQPLRRAASPARARDGRRPGERGRHFLAGVLQTASLYFVLGLRGVQWVTPYLIFFLVFEEGHSALDSAALAALSAIAAWPALIFIAVSAKWLVLGRVRPGRHFLWGAYYLRWWFVQNLIQGLHLKTLGGTPLLPWVYRLFGARIGSDVCIGTDRLAAFDLISIGERSSIDAEAALLGYTIEDGELVIGPVQVGRNCFIGTRSVLREYAVMEDDARLCDLSLVPRGARVPQGETWAGSPARPAPRRDRVPAPPPVRSPRHRAAITAVYGLLVLLFPLVELLAFVPGVTLLTNLNFMHPSFFLAAPLVGGSFVLLLTAEIVILKWLLVGRVRVGTYPVHGSFYIRNWIVDQLLARSLDVVGPLHATLYIAPWYRALGAKLGRFVELSTAFSTTPDLLEIEDGGTVADEASLGAAHIEGGWMTVERTRIGRRAFVGNSAVIPTGAKLGDGSLVGVLSIAPSDRAEAARTGVGWLGSPPILLPRLQPSAAFPEERTYCFPRKLRWARGVFEILRVTLPAAGFIFVTSTVINTAFALWEIFDLSATLLLLPAVYAASCATLLLGVALAKWLVMGRYRPFTRPLLSWFIWRLELVNALYEFLAAPLALDALRGTPLLPWYLRLLGARIGRRVYIETTGFLEWDLVEIGGRAVLNRDCVMQTHLFEDRILKGSRLRIGADCAVGVDSVVLYDSEMQNGARLDALSLLMKGETLPAGTAWAGSPAASGRVGAGSGSVEHRREHDEYSTESAA